MKKLILLLFLSVLASQVTIAQCNQFTKKKCIPQLTPFVHNGQLNSASLGAGETAELELTFYGGQEYRILVCAQDIFKGVHFILKDKSGKELFNSKDKSEQYWDFKVSSTQQLTLEVVTEASENQSGMVESGCVSVLVGFKK